MKLTTPKDREDLSLKDLDRVLTLFEAEFAISSDYSERYHLVIEGEFSRPLCDEVEKRYLAAGWNEAVCKTSSENGERGGLTGLILIK